MSKDIPADAIRSVVSAQFTGVSIDAIEAVEGGKNAVYRISLDGGPAEEIIVKAATATPNRVRSEAAAINHVEEQTEIPVPTVLGTVLPDDEENPLDVSWLLTESVPGESVGPKDEIDQELFEQVAHEAGQYLGRLHAECTFEGVGPLQITEDGLDAALPEDQWADVYRQLVESQLDELEGTRFETLIPEVRTHLEEAAQQVRHEESAQPVMVHLDFRPANFRLLPGEPPVIEAVLDWGGVAAAPPAYELAQTERVLLDRFGLADENISAAKEQFYAGYEQVRGSRTAHTREMQRRFYDHPACLRLMKHFGRLMADEPAEVTEERAREHVRDVRGYLDGL
jgi:aminoglycoside phosphotransferase (APT) family kinase protein